MLIMMENGNHKRFTTWRPAERSSYLFDIFFDAAYHEGLSPDFKDVQRKKCVEGLYKVIDGIDRSSPAKTIILELEKRLENPNIFDFEVFAQRKSLSFDEDLGIPKVMCVGRATLLVSALELLGRYDIIENIRVRRSDYHIWLNYQDNTTRSFEINCESSKSRYRLPLEALLAENLNRTAAELDENGKRRDSVKVYEQSLKIYPIDYSAWGALGYAFADTTTPNLAKDVLNRGLELNKGDTHTNKRLRKVLRYINHRIKECI